MNILLVNTNQEKRPYPIIPLGLCSIASSLKEKGFEPKILDLCFTNGRKKSIESVVRDFGPSLVGISIRNLDNADLLSPISYLQDVRGIVNVFKDSGAPLVIGGPAVTIMPEEIMRFLDVSIAIAGDGEEAMVDLAEGKNPEKVSGLAILKNGIFMMNPIKRPNLDALALPRAFSWLNIKNYFRYGSPYPIQTRRGCSFRCAYCTYNRIEGSSYRLKPLSLVVGEVEEVLRSCSPRSIEFVDSIFNHPMDHAISICEEISRKGIRIPLETMGINPGSFSPELFPAMKKAGFSSIIISAESASEKILHNLRKDFSPGDLERTMKSLRKSGILAMWVFLIGGPGEDENSVKETIRFIEKNAGEKDIIFFTIGIRIYPETEIEKRSLRDGIVKKREELINPVFYLSPMIDVEKILRLIDNSGIRKERTILLTDSSPSFLPVANRLLAFFRLPPPLWRYTPWIKKFQGINLFRGNLQ